MFQDQGLARVLVDVGKGSGQGKSAGKGSGARNASPGSLFAGAIAAVNAQPPPRAKAAPSDAGQQLDDGTMDFSG